jgi:hypothetical protein
MPGRQIGELALAHRGERFREPSGGDLLRSLLAARPVAYAFRLAAICLTTTLCLPAHALIVGTTPGVITDTSTPPVDNPGWANVGSTATFLNAVYLGDGWVLSAKHTGVSAITLSTGTFQPIKIGQSSNPQQQQYQAFVVPNPTGMGLSALTDLRLYRINGDPGLPSLTIASQPPTPGGTIGAEVVMISNGVLRSANETNYSVNSSANPWLWTEIPSFGAYRGYQPNGSGKRWGTNHIANDNAVLGESDANLTGNINAGRGDVISYLTVFDQYAGGLEAQVVGGDSGSGVFYNRDGQWELTGITHANLLYSGQSTATFNPSNSLAIYGNATAFADLSSYHDQILAIMSDHADYSIMGDVNLDGLVSGTGAGPVPTDDISAFVEGWKFDNGLGQGDITSWTKGDLNRDGVTNVADFALLRTAFNGQMSGSVVSQFAGAVPEPSTGLLGLLGLVSLMVRSRLRRVR